MIDFIVNSSRFLRAKLSFPFQKNEKSDTKYNSLLNFLIDYHKKNSIKLNHKNKKKTHLIFSKFILEIILKKKLLNFLQNTKVQKIFFIHNRFFLIIYLKRLYNSNRWRVWKKILKESNVGNPVKYFLYPYTSGNKIFQTYHLKNYEDFSGKKISSYDYVIEFGGGYGNMAHSFCKINPKVKYIIFDTYEVNLLQYYYLNKIGLKAFLPEQKEKEIGNICLINTIPQLKKIVKNLKKINKKILFIANWSLSETPIYFRKKIEFILHLFDNQLISFQNQFESINNKKYFEKLNEFNILNNRKSIISPVEYYPGSCYLLSKSIK